MKRTLRLTREVLGELTTDQLRSVAGGTHLGCATHGNTSCDSCPTLPLNECEVQVASLRPCIETLLCPTTPMGGHA